MPVILSNTVIIPILQLIELKLNFTVLILCTLLLLCLSVVRVQRMLIDEQRVRQIVL